MARRPDRARVRSPGWLTGLKYGQYTLIAVRLSDQLRESEDG